MSLACKCDRCQKFFSPSNKQSKNRITRIKVGLFSLNNDNRGPMDYKDYDLCDSCAEALEVWLNEKCKYKGGDNKDE